MKNEQYSRTGARVIEIPEGSDAGAAFADAEYRNQLIELVHGGRRYQLIPLDGDVEDVEKAWRTAMMARAWAIRDTQEPLGMTTAQLVHESRGENSDDQSPRR
jgi:hypothetical protein